MLHLTDFHAGDPDEIAGLEPRDVAELGVVGVAVLEPQLREDGEHREDAEQTHRDEDGEPPDRAGQIAPHDPSPPGLGPVGVPYGGTPGGMIGPMAGGPSPCSLGGSGTPLVTGNQLTAQGRP